MKTSLNTVSKILAATALVAIAGLAQAAPAPSAGSPASATFAVTTNILPKCTITTTPVAFGDFDPFTGTDLTTAGTVVVGCTKASAGLWVGLDDGLHAVSGQRMMKHTTLDDTLNYALVMPTAITPNASCPAMASGTAWTRIAAVTSEHGQRERVTGIRSRRATIRSRPRGRLPRRAASRPPG